MRRLAIRGQIDRTRPLRFTWNGRPLVGFAGDTLASALLGAGIDVIGTSAVLGRPRGIMADGLEEASGFGQVWRDGVSEPLVRLSAVPLVDGLVAEGGIRAVRGALSSEVDTARFEKRWDHCDLLVVGAGPAGLAAARVGGAAGLRVVLVEARDRLGGALTGDGEPSGRAFVETETRELARLGVTVLLNTTAAIALDQNGMTLVQRVHGRTGVHGRLRHVRARAIVLATGMLERPIVFADNDRPGIMLAGAARSYLAHQALAPRQGVVFTTNDDGYRTALAWHAAGIPVAAVVDPRSPGQGALPDAARAAGLRCLAPAVVVGTEGDSNGRVQAVLVRSARGVERVATDLLAVSGGHAPAIGLHQQRSGATRYDSWWAAPVVAEPLPGQWVAGGANGCRDTAQCVADGVRAAEAALAACGIRAGSVVFAQFDPVPVDEPVQLRHIPSPDGDDAHSFVDLHRDVTVAGLRRAVEAGATHVEHLKRYTLAGTGVEQGRSAALNTGVVLAALLDRPVEATGTSGNRPPVEPIPFHLLAGRAHGPMFEPLRTTSLDARHVAMHARFEPAGLWRRPTCYPRPGESRADAVRRECRTVRQAVGIADVSTLGKLDVQGPDATWFLEQLYVNAIGTMPVGQGRYSMLCRLDGSILDDGLVLRLGPEHYLVTTSTSHAQAVTDWMEEWRQTEWPDRAVWITPVTEQWATVAIAGPRARAVMEALAPEVDVTREGFPFLAVRRGTVAGIRGALLARVSFSGELAWEVSVPWSEAPRLWDAALAAGAPHGIAPYGLEAILTLRMEKGYPIIGLDTEGTTTPLDVGFLRALPARKAFVGDRSLLRPALQEPRRLQLVGIAPWDPDVMIPDGAAITGRVHAPPMTIEGHVTSFSWSEVLGRSLGLALVRGGRARLGDTLFVPLEDRTVAVSLVDPVHYDPAGRRRDGE